jgi:hypothetical protein
MKASLSLVDFSARYRQPIWRRFVLGADVCRLNLFFFDALCKCLCQFLPLIVNGRRLARQCIEN